MSETMSVAREFGLHPLHPATVEIGSLREQLSEAVRQLGRPFVMERGPWTAAWGKRSGSHGDIECPILSSDDFTHDVWLFVAGDFGGREQAMQYAEELARRLNLTAT